jgi:hypothetical protein
VERWQNESIQDQPWHVIEGVYLHDGGDMNIKQQDNIMNSDGDDGVHGMAEDMYSMICNTSGVVTARTGCVKRRPSEG